MSKMDTQGMSADRDPNDNTPIIPQEHKPATITPRRLLTECMVKELKILINEVLDEREYKKKLKGPYDLYDEIEELGHSYFDVEHFKHYVGEDEPPYNR